MTNLLKQRLIDAGYRGMRFDLEELIERCEGKFYSLIRVYNGENLKGWQACAEIKCFVSGEGSTMDEAVAMLWLALQPKKVPQAFSV